MHPTGGRYRFCIPPNLNFIWVKSTVSPAFGRTLTFHPERKQLPDPPLKHLSDTLFLGWKKIMTLAGGDAIKLVEDSGQSQLLPPKLIIRGLITNSSTRAIVFAGLVLSGDKKWSEQKNMTRRELPGIRFGFSLTPDENMFKALLASQNGVAVAYLLIQHRQTFGHQVVTGIRVYNVDTYGTLSLYVVFDIGPLVKDVSLTAPLGDGDGGSLGSGLIL
jgi:hypothetical protein